MGLGLFSEDFRKHSFLTVFEHYLCQSAFLLFSMRNSERAVFGTWKLALQVGFAGTWQIQFWPGVIILLPVRIFTLDNKKRRPKWGVSAIVIIKRLKVARDRA